MVAVVEARHCGPWRVFSFLRNNSANGWLHLPTIGFQI
jgi:hypothetical protein